MKLPDNWHELQKWDKLRVWLKVRFTYAENLHNKTFLGADAAELGVIRSVVSAMEDMDKQEASLRDAQANAVPRRGMKK